MNRRTLCDTHDIMTVTLQRQVYGCIYALDRCGYLQRWYEVRSESTWEIKPVNKREGGAGGELEGSRPGQGNQREEHD